MKKISLRELFFKKLQLLIIVPFIFSCENHRFDSDKRQIVAKNVIEDQFHNVKSFNVTGFKEDTIHETDDPNFKKEIRYSLDIEYVDSNKMVQKKKGMVFFTPDGQSIINSKIIDP
ncbi:MAG TPA: hypothetical protein VIJ57_07965 [Hanamia sp.]